MNTQTDVVVNFNDLCLLISGPLSGINVSLTDNLCISRPLSGTLLRNTEGRVDYVEDTLRRCDAASADVIDVWAPSREHAIYASYWTAISELVQFWWRHRKTGDLPQTTGGPSPTDEARLGLRRQDSKI